MMKVLHPTFTLRVVIRDQSLGLAPRAFYKPAENQIGCDQVLAAVKVALEKANIDAWVILEKFEHS